MLKQGDAMRVMAERYLKLARTSDDARERRKFLGYAATQDPEIREQLLEVADQFERLARHYLFVRMTTPPSEGRQ